MVEIIAFVVGIYLFGDTRSFCHIKKLLTLIILSGNTAKNSSILNCSHSVMT